MPNPGEQESLEIKPPLSPLERRLAKLEEHSQKAQLTIGTQAWLDEGVIPLLKYVQEQNPNEIGQATELASFIEQQLNILGAEAQERSGIGPQLVINDKEYERLWRAGKQAAHIERLYLGKYLLPIIPGDIELSMLSDSGTISLSAELSPSRVDTETLKRWAKEIAPTGDSAVAQKIKQRVGMALPKQDSFLSSANPEQVGQNHLYKKESELLDLNRNMDRQANMDQRLGAIAMSSARGYKDEQTMQVRSALGHFSVSSGLEDKYEIIPITYEKDVAALAYNVRAKDGSSNYVVRLRRNEIPPGDYRVTDQITVRKNYGVVNPHEDLDVVKSELSEDLKVIQSVLDWVYRYSETQYTGSEIAVGLEDETIVGDLFHSGIVEHLNEHTLGRSFEELGGHQQLKERLQSLATAVTAHIRDGALHPGHCVVYGDTGSGKTAMVSATLRKLYEEGVPVYRLRSSPDTGEYLARNPDALVRLFLLVSVNGGVIYIPDLDTTVGINSVHKDTVEAQLNRLLETTSEVSGVWVVADTARPGMVRDSLIQAHRLGANTLDVPIPHDIEEIKDIWQKILSREEYKNMVDEGLDLTEVSERIKQVGGLSPARLVAIVENIRTTNQRVSIETISRGVEEAIKWEGTIREERKRQGEMGWQTPLDALSEQLSRLSEGNRTLSEEQAGVINELKSQVETLNHTLKSLTSVTIPQIQADINALYKAVMTPPESSQQGGASSSEAPSKKHIRPKDIDESKLRGLRFSPLPVTIDQPASQTRI